MTIYETVKAAASVRQAAEHYGLEVNRNGMTCCPFHLVGASSISFTPPQAAGLIHSAAPPLPTKSSILRDPFWHPSMKFYVDHFYCFGCGATGDVIDFTAQLFGISTFEAVKKLAADFGIDPDKPLAAAALAKPKYPMIKTIISAVVHMDEKTPHMHLCFVPLTEDGRLSAKDIVGNKKKLTWWQDEFWKHMVKKCPALERGESASETGRQHIPPRLYKEAVHLNSLKDRIMELLSSANPLNAKSRVSEVAGLLDEYIPGVEKMKTRLRKYDTEYKTLTAENAALESKLEAADQMEWVHRMNSIRNRAEEIVLQELVYTL